MHGQQNIKKNSIWQLTTPINYNTIMRLDFVHWTPTSYEMRSRAKIVHWTTTYMCDDTRDCIIQFCPPDDEHMCSKHVEAWNKLIIKFSASSWLILINKYI